MEKSGLTKENDPNSFGGNQSLFFKTWQKASGQEGVSSECWCQKVPKDVDALIRSLEFLEVDIWSFLSWFGVLFAQKKHKIGVVRQTTVIWRWSLLKLVLCSRLLFSLFACWCKMIPNLIFVYVSKGWQKYDPPTSFVCVCACVFFWNSLARCKS